VWYEIGPVVGCCEHGNELSGSIKKAGNFFGSRDISDFTKGNVL
jgi:hypothetical protein